jgi:DNA-binding MarR family transcriptional regulator
LRESHRSAIADNLGRAAGNGHRVLQHLYQRPMVSVNDVRDLIETTYPAANQLVDRMVQCGILMEITGQSRNRLFQYESYIRLFDEQHHQPNA